MSTVPCAPGWFDCLLGREEKRRRRSVMAAVATSMMVCCALVMHIVALGGSMHIRALGWWSTFAVGGLFTAFLLVRSGHSERWADPYLMLFQMRWALTFNAVAYVLAGPIRALVLPVLVIILMFGIFGQKRRQTLNLMVYGMVLYTAAVLAGAYLDDPRPPAEVVLAHLTIVLLSLLAGTLMCLKVQSMRARLRRKKVELEMALVQIRDLAMRDELTGLINRRQMVELVELERSRSERSGRLLLLAQLDIDHFKAINDTHGHAAGDKALQAFADTALAHLRAGDVLARWGGEEFVLLLSGTPPEAATELLERVRDAVAALSVPNGDASIHMTVSIGWAQYQRGESFEQTLERADQALYGAKNRGRNCVVGAPVTAAQAPVFASAAAAALT